AVGRRLNTAQHVNIVIRRSTRTVHCQKYLPCQSSRIYIPAVPHATQIHLGDLFKDWRLIANLRITGPNAPKRDIVQILSADEQIAIGINIRRPMNDTMGNIDRILPAHAAVCGAAKFSGRAGKEVRPELVLKSMTW